MKIKGFHFIFTSSGVVETSQEVSFSSNGNAKTPCLIYSEVLAFNDHGVVLNTENSIAVASIVEKWIAEELARQSDNIQESALVDAINYANFRMQHSKMQGISQAALSVVLMTATPPTESDAQEILIAGVGDSRVYQIKPDGAELIFIDPLNREINKTLDPEDRLYALNNAIGARASLQVHCKRVNQNVFQRFVAISYGFYQQTCDREIFELGLKPHDYLKGVRKCLSKKHLRGNIISLYSASFGSIREMKPKNTDENNQAKLQRKVKRKKSIVTLSIAASLALVLSIGTLFLSKFSSETPPLFSKKNSILINDAEHDQIRLKKTVAENEATIANLKIFLEEERTRCITLKDENDRLKQQNSPGVSDAPSIFPHVEVGGFHGKYIHYVTRGETLFGISTKYYGSISRWQDILDANKHVLNDKNKIKEGTALVIP